MAVELTPSSALGLWHSVSLEQVRLDGRDLTQRQLAVLLEVYLVRGLAAKLGVTKPVITRALDTMGDQGLLTRTRDEKDRRSVVVKRTVEGALFLERFGDVIIREGRKLQN